MSRGEGAIGDEDAKNRREARTDHDGPDGREGVVVRHSAEERLPGRTNPGADSEEQSDNDVALSEGGGNGGDLGLEQRTHTKGGH